MNFLQHMFQGIEGYAESFIQFYVFFYLWTSILGI